MRLIVAAPFDSRFWPDPERIDGEAILTHVKKYPSETTGRLQLLVGLRLIGEAECSNAELPAHMWHEFFVWCEGIHHSKAVMLKFATMANLYHASRLAESDPSFFETCRACVAVLTALERYA